MPTLSRIALTLVALASIGSASAAPSLSSNTPAPFHPPELCRGLGNQAYDDCVAWVTADREALRQARARHSALQNGSKLLPVILKFKTGETQHAALTYEGIGGRVVPAGATLQVDCFARTPLPEEEKERFAAGSCKLNFPGTDPHWTEPSYHVNFGIQPAAWVGLDKSGFIDIEYVLTLDPIPSYLITPVD